MLLKKYKLKSNSEISRVFKNGKTVKSSFLFLRYRPSENEITRIAFSIGLKYSKKAVMRNQAKRILRASSKELMKKIKKGYDLVFYFDKNFQEPLDSKIVLEKMKSCLYSANLLE